MNIASTDWRDTVTSTPIPWGPGAHVLEVEWLATKGRHGYFRAFIDGKLQFEYSGPTMYAHEAKDGLKVQMGLYKTDWGEAEKRERSRQVGVTTRTYYVTYFGTFRGERSPEPVSAPVLLP